MLSLPNDMRQNVEKCAIHRQKRIQKARLADEGSRVGCEGGLRR